MEGVQPSQPQEKKSSYAEAVEQSLLVVRGDDKAAQHEKEIDEKPGVAQERHAVQMAVGVQMEQRHQARGDTAPTVQYHESFHVRPERLKTVTAPHSLSSNNSAPIFFTAGVLNGILRPNHFTYPA